MKKSAIPEVLKRKDLLLFFVFFISGISILGWIFNEIILTSVSSKFIPIAPSTALQFFILSSILIIKYNFKKSIISISFTSPMVILVALFSIIVLFRYLFNYTWDIENIFIANPENFGDVSIGRMSPVTASLFFLTSFSILTGIRNYSNIIRFIGGTSSLLTLFTSFILLIGYLYDAPLLYGSQIIPV